MTDPRGTDLFIYLKMGKKPLIYKSMIGQNQCISMIYIMYNNELKRRDSSDKHHYNIRD